MEDAKAEGDTTVFTNPALPVTVPAYGGGVGDGLTPAGAALVAHSASATNALVGTTSIHQGQLMAHQCYADIRREIECQSKDLQRDVLETKFQNERTSRDVQFAVAEQLRQFEIRTAETQATIRAEAAATRDFLRDREAASANQQNLVTAIVAAIKAA